MKRSDPLAGPRPFLVNAGRCAVLAATLFTVSACGSGGGGGGTIGNPSQEPSSAVRLADVSYGRLVDVFGLRTTSEGTLVELFERDVIIGTNIRDQRGVNEEIPDSQISYDFLAADPDTLQPRLLIPREIGSQEFGSLFAALDDEARSVTPSVFGQDVSVTPFPVVPRNAGIRLTFTGGLTIDNSFFYEINENGAVTGLRNTEAVQLLRIAGDPTDEIFIGDFRVVPMRLNVKDNTIIIDPVLLGSESLQFQSPPNARGLPESPAQQGANIRIALALDGPLSIPQLREDSSPQFTGINNVLGRAVVRDFRSGNADDSSSDIANGFVRDPEPPRLLGELPVLLANVDSLGASQQFVEIFKNGLVHDFDRGDVLTFLVQSPGGGISTIGSSEILVEPTDDDGAPEVQSVRCVIRRLDGLEDIDPTNEPGYPVGGSTEDIRAFLRENAPGVILATDFSLGRDSAENFITFSPGPIPDLETGEPGPPTANVSPFASAIVRFSKPVDLDTVRPADTFFIATRDLFDRAARDAFRDGSDPQAPSVGIPPNLFSEEKYRTPHLISAQRRDEDGSQTTLRLEPLLGMYLDQRMRDDYEDEVAAAQAENRAIDPPFKYFVHVLGGEDGIRDLSGNPIDFQAIDTTQAGDSLTIPFSLDMRTRVTGVPVFPDNRVAHVVRRFSSTDEDERPSYYIERERDGDQPVFSLPVADAFGPLIYLDNGRFVARLTSRARRAVDDVNQEPPPSQQTPQRWCIENFGGGEMGIASATGGTVFGQPIQNPLNPFGSRLQAVWREIDLSLSRTDPEDFNLDVEQMYWGIFDGGQVTFDEFDDTSLFLGHSEYRPEPCVGSFNSSRLYPDSGLRNTFAENYAANITPTGAPGARPAPFPAYQSKRLRIIPGESVDPPVGDNRFFPLPEFEREGGLFVYRDETLTIQGGNVEEHDDTGPSGPAEPYIISPWLNGEGRDRRLGGMGQLEVVNGFWCNFDEFQLQGSAADNRTEGGLLSIALPLLADFQVLPDRPDLPVDNPFRASGANGWQISIAVQAQPVPAFRVYSGGGGSQDYRVEPGTPDWTEAMGGFVPGSNQRTSVIDTDRPSQGPIFGRDNSVYWIMVDFLKRQSVATAGFVELLDPHRLRSESGTVTVDDPRLGPYTFDGQQQMPSDVTPFFTWAFDPPRESLPAGTSIVPQFRAASRVDANPWRFNVWAPSQRGGLSEEPDADNFPLDPKKAGDAGVRKFDNRSVNGSPRNFWAYNYNRQVTDYTNDPNELSDPAFLANFVGPNESLQPQDVVYFNWRFIMINNVDAQVPVSPSADTFMVAYRFDR